ncbi:hypothetical protein EVAR_54060_1 [Eumeta japonica]|uniref:Uncharacterized protein n=1 Tax=Eumeta variegata TaxID=151549 RepID=A0A4C1XIM3_EUMVA|nr:hypothetical protein EVAR_54060_1 [Eumeta japonica]
MAHARHSPRDLYETRRLFDEYVCSLQVDAHSPLFRLVTDGQPPLRYAPSPRRAAEHLAGKRVVVHETRDAVQVVAEAAVTAGIRRHRNVDKGVNKH